MRAPRKSIAAGLGLTVVAGAIFLWINVATHDQWFLNTITANANVYDYQQALQLYGHFFSLHFLIAALTIGYAVYELYWDRLSAFTVWFAFSIANAAFAGKWGAGESYFGTTIVAACVLSGFAVGKIKERLPQKFPKASIAIGLTIPLFYLFQAWGVRHLPTDGPIFGSIADLIGVGRNTSVYFDPAGKWSYPYYDSIGYTQVGHLPTEADIRAGDLIVNIIRSSGKVALTEEAMLAFRANQPVITNPTQLLNLWNNQALDPTDLIAMIDQQKFGAIVFRAQFYPPPVLQAVGARYQPIDDILMNGFVYHILAPRSNYGAGCDEARFYSTIATLKSIVPATGFVQIADRDSKPDGWSGPNGVSEINYLVGDRKNSQIVYRLWIGPLTWQGQPPSNGSGATQLGRTNCFSFFDEVNDTNAWPNASEAVVKTLGIIH
ncbi:MAG TPA: hypothetical protein VFF70_02830 [Anaerolineae bacterium]|nr:hypothetical protein [Anaerolineae bacterium]